MALRAFARFQRAMRTSERRGERPAIPSAGIETGATGGTRQTGEPADDDVAVGPVTVKGGEKFLP